MTEPSLLSTPCGYRYGPASWGAQLIPKVVMGSFWCRPLDDPQLQMKSDNEFGRSMRRLSDGELLDIVEGRKLGYREEAVLAAQEVLRDRGVPFEPVDPSVLTKTMADVYVVWDRLRGLSVRRGRGRYLTAAGTAALLVWFMGSGPSQDVVLAVVGVVALIWGAIILITTQRIITELGPVWDRYENVIRRAQSKMNEAGKAALACFLLFALVAVVDALFF